MYIIIYLKNNVRIIYRWNDRAINLCVWTMTFPLWHSDPDASFQNGRVLYVYTPGVYIIQWLVWAASPRQRTVDINSTFMKTKWNNMTVRHNTEHWNTKFYRNIRVYKIPRQFLVSFFSQKFKILFYFFITINFLIFFNTGKWYSFNRLSECSQHIVGGSIYIDWTQWKHWYLKTL